MVGHAGGAHVLVVPGSILNPLHDSHLPRGVVAVANRPGRLGWLLSEAADVAHGWHDVGGRAYGLLKS